MANIDARLEKLVARHEALTESVELIASMQQKTEAELDKLSRFVRLIGADHNKRITKLEKGKN